jgi:hypothetical protein
VLISPVTQNVVEVFLDLRKVTVAKAQLRPQRKPCTPFLGLPLGELTDAHVDLETLWGRAGRELRERVCTARTLADRFDESPLAEPDMSRDVADCWARLRLSRMSSSLRPATRALPVSRMVPIRTPLSVHSWARPGQCPDELARQSEIGDLGHVAGGEQDWRYDVQRRRSVA